jgi:ubiquinone/menaquinone biosynthesis C-methylase UbiE
LQNRGKKRSANQKYHDRIAKKYDDLYEHSYWEFYDAITWGHIKKFLPMDLASSCLDLGCGTGKWGFKLAKTGFPVTFVDLSALMVAETKQRSEECLASASKCEFIQADICQLGMLPKNHFSFALAQGDPLSLVDSPLKALAQIREVLKPEGILLASVDNRAAGFWYYLEKGDLDGLKNFAETGRTHWLTKEKTEQFPVKMFLPKEIEHLLEKTGFALLDMIGKTVLDMRRYAALLEDKQNLRSLIQLECDLHHDPSLIGLASHLEFVAKKL